MFKMGIVNGINRTLDTRKKATLIGQINDPNSRIAKLLKTYWLMMNMVNHYLKV